MPKLVLQHTYESVEIAIYYLGKQIAFRLEEKHQASSKLILAIDFLLKKASLKLSDLEVIIVNQGPGPFTTLRTVISTINGLAFATNLKIIGVNGLKALINYDLKDIAYPKVILFNAFANDVYFAIKTADSLELGVDTVDNLILKLNNLKSFFIAGNGFSLHKDKFNSFDYQEIFPSYPTLDAIYYESHNQPSFDQVLPLYLKQIKYF